MRLFFRDTQVLLRLLRYLPWLFLPLKSKDKNAELILKRRNVGETALQIFLFVFEVVLLLAFLPALILLPGLAFLAGIGLAFIFIYLIAMPLEGPDIAFSHMDENTQRQALEHSHERWVFINGCTSGCHSLQGDIDCLSSVFKRSVLGIHNRTYGLVADILECLIQRVFDYKTLDVRVAHEQMKIILCDKTTSKVILIGHSQ